MIKATLVTLTLFAFASPAFADWASEKMDNQIEKTNVIVGEGCSGTIIDTKERLVLTAYHCINDSVKEEIVKEVDDKTGEIREKKIQKRIPLTIRTHKLLDYEIIGTEDHLVKIVGTDSKNDIAILQVVDTDFIPRMQVLLAPDSFQYKRGTKVYAIGNPGIEFDNSITEGIISAPQRTVDFGDGQKFKMFQHSAGTIGGNSGGAIVNDRGEIIGTVTGGLRGAPISFAIPISFTKELLRKSGFSKVLENTTN